MKNEELDRLFKQKSELFRAEPSPEAWHQLDEQLKNKRGNKKWIFFSGLAASFLLITGLWIGMNQEDLSTTTTPVVSLKQEKENVKVTKLEPTPLNDAEINKNTSEAAERSPKSKKEEENFTAEELVATKTRKNNHTVALHQPNKKEKAINSSKRTLKEVELPQLKTREVEPIEMTDSGSGMGNAIALVPEIPESIIIRYSPEDAKVTPNSPESSVSAEPLDMLKEEKELSVRSVIGFIKNVKDNSTGSLSDIREAKNNFLSLRLGQQN